MEAFRKGKLSASEAAAQLGVCRSRLYTLGTDYFLARARKQAHLWVPGRSGGDHTTAWPEPVVELLKKRLGCSPPCPYSFVASEALRLHGFKRDRAQVRRWALQQGLAHATVPQRPRAPVRRWQRSQISELWQLDASPHPWFPGCALDFPMLNMLDDCSRVFVGARELGTTIVFTPITFTEDYHKLTPQPYGILKGVVDSKSFRKGTWG